MQFQGSLKVEEGWHGSMGRTLIDVAGFDDKSMNETRGIKELEKASKQLPLNIVLLTSWV